MRKVAPFMGAWIEIAHTPDTFIAGEQVAPFMGAWIEIRLKTKYEILDGTSRAPHGRVD